MTQTTIRNFISWLRTWFDDIYASASHTHTISQITDYTNTGLTYNKQRVWSDSINLTYTLYVDETNRNCTLTISGSSISIASGNSNYEVGNFVPSAYRPKNSLFCRLQRSNNLLAYMWDTGTVGIANFNSSTSTNQSLSGQIDWNY